MTIKEYPRPVTICPYCGAKKFGSPNIQRDTEIRELYGNVWPLEELSEKFHIGIPRLKHIIGKENLRDTDRYKKPWALKSLKKRNKKILDLYNEGKSYRAIGKEVHLSGERVRHIVFRMNRQKRTGMIE